MKYIFLFFTIVFSFVNLTAQSNAIDTYFQQYVEDERFSVVYISPKLFELMDRLGADELNLNDSETAIFKDVATDLRGLRILSTDETPEAFYNAALAKIDTDLYELLMTVRSKNQSNLEFLIREADNGIIEELLMISGSEENFFLMSFVGKIDLDKVIQLANEIEEGDDDRDDDDH